MAARASMFSCDNPALWLIKWLLVISNVCIWMLGGLSVCVGIYFYTHHKYTLFSHLLGLCLFTATGFLVLVIGFVGAVAAIRESGLLLYFYAFFMSSITGLYLVAGVWSFIQKKNEVDDNLYQKLINTMGGYNSSYAYRKIWDDLQVQNECCGINGWRDWMGKISTRTVPDSCCIEYSSGCGISSVPRGKFHENGCLSVVSQHNNLLYDTVGSLGISIGTLQTLGIASSFILQRMLCGYKKSYTID